MTNLPTVAVVLVLLAAIPTAAYPPEAMALDDAWMATPRSYEVQWNQQGFQVRGTSVALDQNDTVMVSFNAATHELILQYLAPEGPDQKNRTVELHIHIAAVVEFQDHDNDLRYSLGDPIVRRIPIEEAFRPTVSRTQTTAGDELRIDYGLPQSFRARLQLVLTVPDAASAAAANNTSSFPLEIRFSNFEFRSDNRTRLALETRVSPGIILDPHAVGNEAGRTQTFWAWAPEAKSGDAMYPVGTTLQPYGAAEGEQTLVIFSHGRNSTVSHDTILGILRTEPSLMQLPILQAVGDWRVFLTGTLIAVGIMVITVRRAMSRED